MLLTVLTLLCALALLLFFLLMPGESDFTQRQPFWNINIAHRGLHKKDLSIPENSMAAFTAAIDAGYGIELDIRLSQDDAVVVFHDEDLGRVCGVPGRVGEKPLAELKKLRLYGTNQLIPTLREVLEAIDGRVPLVIELKHGKDYKKLCELAWRILRRYDGEICVESFDPRIVRWFYKNVPGLLRGQLAAPPKNLKQGFKGYAVGWLFANCIGRPHFIAYQKGPKPLIVNLVCKFAMRVVWTARPEDHQGILEMENDAVIFEYYEPEPYFQTPEDT
ncbi:glycerophosphodiester phosphodiesterase [Ruminococcaceae bacterium OttesenSCG-928-I18]|nr:glycerophosphodiester phosphodiesterase [Ruminococcaceae bacterium OttesenSCG-928-I18]